MLFHRPELVVANSLCIYFFFVVVESILNPFKISYGINCDMGAMGLVMID